MKRSAFLLLLFALFLLFSCSRKNAVEPDVGTSGLQTFVLTGADDARLPAPGDELQGITPSEEAFLEGLLRAGSSAPGALARRGHSDPARFWNLLTVELGRTSSLPTTLFARANALVHVAIFDAMVAGRHGRRGGLADEALAAGAASEVLFYLFPRDSARIKDSVATQMGPGGRRKTERSFMLGKRVGELAVEHGRSDGSDAVFTGAPPAGECKWTGSNPQTPLAGTWKTWVIASGTEFLAEPPFACGSTEDLKDLEDVYQLSLARTAEQIAIARKWGEPPPVSWNRFLNERRVTRRGSNELASARAYAFLNVAIYDAFVVCWNSKYAHWMARPFMRLGGRSPAFATVIPTPPHPSYPSGHSTVSAAAALIMGELFPDEKDFFLAQAEEAAVSRFYAGIHYNHDDNAGLALGRRVGAKILPRLQRERNHPFLSGP